MPDGTDWGLAWIRLERAIQKKLDKLESGEPDRDRDYRSVRDEISLLEEVQELMSKYEPKSHGRKKLGI